MSADRARAELESAVTTAMLRVFDKVQRSRRLACDYGTGDRLTMVEAEVCHLVAAERAISPSELAERTGVSRSAVSQALNRMRERGLVVVDQPAGNARAREVRVTDAGALVADGVNAMYREMAAAVYGDAPDDLEAFLGLFTRLDTFFDQVMRDS
ncbi:MarR family winged helix-turn-helix transcriptional regulator [Dietzia sp. DQ12-76]|uniref:MarR family winged helix-turn-helix transcriptional regulator n=2 Tax=unclassified Dietzia TaxID=2617939 RepID=UPI0015FA9D37|nr:MarR family transcriptional regulator [Dietzia sp. DQ12-76]MBB1024813.1 MarR family transcriptional regulator [Dietzia sp. DQ12-76]